MKDKIELLVKFLSSARQYDDPQLNELDELDDLRNEVYKENRIKHDFGTAADMANRAVLNKVLLKEEKCILIRDEHEGWWHIYKLQDGEWIRSGSVKEKLFWTETRKLMTKDVTCLISYTDKPNFAANIFEVGQADSYTYEIPWRYED